MLAPSSCSHLDLILRQRGDDTETLGLLDRSQLDEKLHTLHIGGEQGGGGSADVTAATTTRFAPAD